MRVTFRSSETRALTLRGGAPRHIEDAPFRNAARAAARAASLASSAAGYHPVPTIPRGGFASSSKPAPRRARDPPRTASIAGDATREYLVKLPAEEMAAGLDEAQSGVRARLITLTSVGAAVYLGYYIFPLVGAPARPPTGRNLPNLNRSIRRTTFHPFAPASTAVSNLRIERPTLHLPGGGTASSATQMLRSKDVLFQRAGVTRLRAVLASPGGGTLVADAVSSHSCAEALVRVARAFRDERVGRREWKWGFRGWGRKRGAEGVPRGCRRGCREGVEEGGEEGRREGCGKMLESPPRRRSSRAP